MPLPAEILRAEPWFLRFHDLMPYRVREVLLVSSDYDAYVLEEDGSLTERLYSSYSELNLSLAPRITHASSMAAAIQLLAERRFDLVLTVVRVEDADAASIAKRVKELRPDLPVAMLIFDEADLHQFRGHQIPEHLDHVFLWTGDAQILTAAIKLIEDERNRDHDFRRAGVQAILVVEDQIRPYSSFLALLYAEVMAQSQSLIDEGLNQHQKLLRMRARPKIALARNYDDAEKFWRQHREHVLAIISDVRFPKGGVEHAEAGLELARLVRSQDVDLPFLLQSAEPRLAESAAEIGVASLDKNAPNLLSQIRNFLRVGLGFGPFVFYLTDGTEVARVRTVYEMEQEIPRLPAESVYFHASRNHFSLWLNARCLFDLAAVVRRKKIADFTDIEDVRRFLVDILRAARQHEQTGVVVELGAHPGTSGSRVVRVGRGSLGGKGRGVAFVNTVLARSGLGNRYPELEIRIPKTVAIGTNAFDSFLELNAFPPELLQRGDDQMLLHRFLEGQLAPELQRDIEIAYGELQGPLAVRSSSLLEDSRFQPFAGIYSTIMLPNTHADPAVRQAELLRAIKAVYASTFGREAHAYFARLPHSLEEEKMGIVIQEVVGRRYGDRFYPHASGVAQSYNHYPVGDQKPEEGVVLIALGLGHTVLSAGTAVRFSPATPGVFPQFPRARDFLRNTQKHLCALDLSTPIVDFLAGAESSLRQFPLEAAESDGTMRLVGSVYSAADDVIRENFNLAGPRVVTFANILKWNSLPLADAICDLLTLFRDSMGGDVELEFALDLGSKTGDRAALHLLQVRPTVNRAASDEPIVVDEYPPEELLARSDRAVGDGRFDGIFDVIYVKSGSLDGTRTPQVAREIGAATERLRAEKRPFLLIGPGRWGSSDPALGIPVDWTQIEGAAVLAETDFETRVVDPSQGTHFFQNVTVLQIGYFKVRSIKPGDSRTAKSFVDLGWLDRLPAERESDYVRSVRLAAPLRIWIDGRTGAATVLKPSPAA